MLFEGFINSWALQFIWLLDQKNLFAFFSKFKIDATINEVKKEADFFLGYTILMWSVLYLIYEKWLHLILRRKYFSLIQRNRIVSTIWDSIFCICTINYLLYIFFISSENSVLPNLMKFSFILCKSFYIHHAGVNIFIHGLWMKGWSDLLFSFFAFNRYWQRSSLVFLLLKVIDTTILVVCRLLFCFWNTQINKKFTNILFIFNCFTWSFIYLFCVAEYVLWGRNSKHLLENSYMWMWFISECLNSIWLSLFCRLEIHLFPPPSQDAIEFVNRLKIQKAALQKKPSTQNAKKAELLKTVTCMMAVKKKVQRMRKAKEAKINLQTVSEEKNEEANSDKDTKKKEIMQNLICAMTERREIWRIRTDKRNNLEEAVTDNENRETDFAIDEAEEESDKNIQKGSNIKMEETSV